MKKGTPVQAYRLLSSLSNKPIGFVSSRGAIDHLVLLKIKVDGGETNMDLNVERHLLSVGIRMAEYRVGGKDKNKHEGLNTETNMHVIPLHKHPMWFAHRHEQKGVNAERPSVYFCVTLFYLMAGGTKSPRWGPQYLFLFMISCLLTT